MEVAEKSQQKNFVKKLPWSILSGRLYQGSQDPWKRDKADAEEGVLFTIVNVYITLNCQRIASIKLGHADVGSQDSVC